MAKRKCVVCGQFIENNEDSVPYKGRYAHRKCFQATIKIATTEKKKELSEKVTTKKKKATKLKAESIKDSMTEDEYQEKIKFFDCLRRISGIEELSAKVYVLAEDYIKKYSFTYESMRQALEFHFDICGNNPVGDCIGLVPYIHDEAKKYFHDMNVTRESIKDINFKTMYKEKTIKIRTTRQKSVQLLDIENIGKDTRA